MPPRCLSAAERQVAMLMPYYDPRTREGISEISSKTGYTRDYLLALLTRLRRKYAQGRINAYHIGSISMIGLRLALVALDRDSSVDGVVEDYTYETFRARDGAFRFIFVPSWPSATGDTIMDILRDRAEVLLTGHPAALVNKRIVQYDHGETGSVRLVDVLLFTVLEYSPLASQLDVCNLTPILAHHGYGDSVWLRKRKVLARYRELSSKGALGRAIVFCRREPYILLVVDNDCPSAPYDAASLARDGAAYIVRGDEATALLLSSREASLRRIVERLEKSCIHVARFVQRIERKPLPLTYFEPRRGWMLEPQPLLKYMYTYGLLARNSAIHGHY